jgi:hypothetical protein
MRTRTARSQGTPQGKPQDTREHTFRGALAPLPHNRALFPLAVAFAVIAAGSRAGGQEAPHVGELRFVRDLRARHYSDLALDYLDRLKKNNPSPELLSELPLEFAETRLDAAADEPDSGKRLALFEQARGEFEAFLVANPEHPRAAEAKLDVARAVVLQGKTQLSRALLQDSLEARIAEGNKARQTFLAAAVLLKKAADDIDALLAKVADGKTDAEQARAKKLENDRLQARLAVALNLIDQAQTYFDEGNVPVMIERGKKVEEAARLLEKLSGQDATNPICWEASAWLGRCLLLNGAPPKARAKLGEVINSAVPAAADGRRLARYFRLLVQTEAPLPEEEKDPKFLSSLIAESNGWLLSYPSFARTPEGYGLRYLLAERLNLRAMDPKTSGPQKEADLVRARQLLKQVEQTENDFTDRARRLKIGIIKAQGGFTRNVTALPTFEDCYVRAQYEVFASAEDAKPEKDGAKPDAAKLEEMKKKRTETAIAALERGLTLPDAKPDRGKVAPEVNSAKAMLAFFCLEQRRYRDAIKYGEGFARDDPRSGQAAMAGIYALQAYAQLIGQRERDNALPEELRPEREKMLALARYVEERWPKEMAGDVARHQLALALLREERQSKDAAEQVRLLGEAVAKLAAVRKDYPSYILTQYQLADACLQAERDNLDPAPGHKPGDYRQQALAVLTTLPDPQSGADTTVGQFFAMGKIKLAWELYRDKKVEAMLQLGEELAKKLPTLPMDETARQQMIANAMDVRLFASGSIAEADFGKARYAEACTRLDPLTAAVLAPDANPDNKLVIAELKKNPQLGSALMSMDLRANVQLARLDRVEPSLKALQSLTAEGEDAGGASKVLQTLVFLIKQQIDELDKKGDRENKEKAVDGFTKILDKVAEHPDKLEMQPRLLLAQCYANMARHHKAAELLEKVATPAEREANPAERGAQLLYARELRLDSELEKARQVLDSIIGTKTAPGWGARNAEVLLEDVSLLEDERKYEQAALKANDVVRRLLPSVNKDNALKEKYFEAYYHVVYSFVKYGQTLTDPAMRDKALKRAAAQTVELEQKWPNFGGDASSRRFNDLLTKEADFKGIVEELRAKNK